MSLFKNITPGGGLLFNKPLIVPGSKGLGNPLGNITKPITDTTKTVTDTATNAVGEVKNTATDAAGGVKSTITDAASGVKNAVTDVASGAKDLVDKAIPELDMNKLLLFGGIAVVGLIVVNKTMSNSK